MARFIKLLTPEAVPKFAPVIAKAFCKMEPLSSHLKLDAASFTKWTAEVATAACPDGLSCVAYEAKTSKVLGGWITHRISNPAWLAGNYPALEPVIKVLDMLKPPPYIEKADPSKVMHLFMVGALTPEEGGQKGITMETLLYTFAIAKAKGIKYGLIEMTSEVTQHVCLNKIGFEKVDELVYSKCGVPQFKTLQGKAALGVLNLDNYKVPTPRPA